MQELIQTIATIKQRIKDHEPELSGNEAMTRYALIDPLLKALGWDVSNPAIVTPEEHGPGGTTDYKMGDVMVVEAKKLGERLDKHAGQLIEYVRKREVRLGVLTNGRLWRMYDSRYTTKVPAVEFDVTDPEGVIIPEVAQLHRLSVTGSPYEDRPESTPAEAPAEDPDGWKALSEVRHVQGMAHPVRLRCGDTVTPLNSWVDILVGVTEWLVAKKYLDKSDCPIPIGSKNCLLNTEPVHPNGRRFSTSKKVGKLYVYTNVDPQTAMRYAGRLIAAAGLEPADFGVQF